MYVPGTYVVNPATGAAGVVTTGGTILTEGVITVKKSAMPNPLPPGWRFLGSADAIGNVQLEILSVPNAVMTDTEKKRQSHK